MAAMYWVLWLLLLLPIIGIKATAFAVFIGLCGGGCWWCGREL
jgi:hypothetical protein